MVLVMPSCMTMDMFMWHSKKRKKRRRRRRKKVGHVSVHYARGDFRSVPFEEVERADGISFTTEST